MNKKLIIGLAATTALATVSALAGEASIYDTIWDYGTFIDNKDAAVVQKFGITGRLQGDAFSFADDNDNENEDMLWRRFRFGFKGTLFQDFTVHAEADLDANELDSGSWDEIYGRLTDAYVKWDASDAVSLKVGKQSAGFTLDGATSSKKLLVPERSIVAGNLWFGTEYFTGASIGGKMDDWSYKVGGFSGSGEDEFGHFDNGYFGLVSLGRKTGEKGKLRLDYVYNDTKNSVDYGKKGTTDMEHIVALVHTTKLSDKLGIWSDLVYGAGMDDKGDLFGGSVMPFYDISDNFQLVAQYAGVTSLNNDADVKMSRYASRNVGKTKVEEAHNLLLGFNWYLYGHKLKWQNAVEYNYGKNLASSGDDYNGYGVTSAIRISW